ncbi:phosphate/phosphite/phosphonate ABC transporter substrate-binding protein [Nocardia camponoti]|uniref:ABC transporter substrate-binding protein n=1 Tax=Nocardia camponoti TaxID=1616106 RepID=A0A917QT54_9NOCA|nr:phosphate/phosphite/phosphonate ABC transporter substrate-binding protein [Nocardia camponoti]GGK67232.1 ABC transporter substrate-binding protein [Nocardia camponoti]
MSTKHRIFSLVTALSVAPMLLTGCGASDDTAAPADPNAACVGKSDAAAPAPTKLTLALVPSGDANKLVQTVKPLEEALTQRLGIPVKGVITQDYQAAVEAIGAGQAQIGMLPPLQMVQACDRYQAVPALQSTRAGKITYAAQFYTNNPAKYCADTPAPGAKGLLFCNGTADGNGPKGLDQIAKVKGAKMVSLESASSAGYIYPSAALKAVGVDIKKDTELTQVGGHPAAVAAALKGDAEVGVSYWDARQSLLKDSPEVTAKLVVFALTKEIPNDGVSITSKLNPEWQNKIKQALLDYAGTDEGVKALNAIYQITGLKPADPVALQAAKVTADSVGR